ncbi:MAG: alpha/beta hydrolase [Deltaproteobacteria bacterium]|nr:alpha/beta hydrolase [Deltaproteobacteria bacterium]
MSADLQHIDAPIRQRTVTSRDGTRLEVYRIGAGPRVWLMPPAMGAPLVSMKHLLEHFARSLTIVTWDMRGFYRSGAPADAEAFGVEHHLADLDAVVEAEALDRFVLGGWSMGVQISLEHQHRHPERVTALVLIHGPYEHVLASTRLGSPRLLLPLLDVLTARAGFVTRANRRLFSLPPLARVLHRTGLLARNPDHFAEVLADFSTIDWGRYLRVVAGLHAHSAAPHLSQIRVPTLITAGTHDLLTPVAVAERMHRAIPGSELFVLEGGTHYSVVEFPEALCERIDRFLAALER